MFFISSSLVNRSSTVGTAMGEHFKRQSMMAENGENLSACTRGSV